MHELNIVVEIEFTGFQGLLLIFDVIWQFDGLVLFYVYVHFGQVDLLFFLQELVDGLFFLYW